MKMKFGVLVFGISLTSLMLNVGCAEDQSRLNAPLQANAAPGIVLAAEPEAQEPAKPAETPVPVVKNDAPATPAAPVTTAVPPGSIVITKTNATPATNVVQAPPAQPPQLSPALSEVVRLLQANVGQDILLTYITNSTQPFYVGASEIVYLHDLGAPTSIITALITLDASPEMVARKQAAIAVKPLPPGVALNEPATNVFPPRATTKPAPNPPDPVPVNPPPPNQGATYVAPPPEDTTVTYDYPQPATEVNYNYFYTSLAPYGSWVDVPGYGSCWRPTCATWNSSWRPYVDGGRWLWSDAGWYWYSDYSWGWAPFHYGRWCRPSGFGWVWVPDTVWGPSWVSWRYSSGYCGWAPLPPSARFVSGLGFYYHTGSVGIGFEFGLGISDYCYIPTARFCDRRPVAHCVPHHRNHEIHKDTTVINNYIVGNNNTIVNNGFGVEKISRVTRGDIKRVALRDTASVKSLGTRHERLEADGSSLTVYRPPTTVLARKSVVAAPSQTATVTTRPSTYVNSYVKPAAAVRGGSLGDTRPSVVSGGANGGVKTPSSTYAAPTVMNSKSGPTPVTLYTKPATTANQPVIVTGGPTPPATYTKPVNSEPEPSASPFARSPRNESRFTKPAAGSTAAASTPREVVSSPVERNAKSSSAYTKPVSGSSSAGHAASVSAGTDPIKSPFRSSPNPSVSAGAGSTSPRSSGYTRAESGRSYTQPSAPRPSVSHAPSQSYSRPAPSAPSQSYTRPSAPSYSAPARSESHQSRVSAPSGGGHSGGSYTRPSSSSSSSSSEGKKGR